MYSWSIGEVNSNRVTSSLLRKWTRLPTHPYQVGALTFEVTDNFGSNGVLPCGAYGPWSDIVKMPPPRQNTVEKGTQLLVRPVAETDPGTTVSDQLNAIAQTTLQCWSINSSGKHLFTSELIPATNQPNTTCSPHTYMPNYGSLCMAKFKNAAINPSPICCWYVSHLLPPTSKTNFQWHLKTLAVLDLCTNSPPPPPPPPKKKDIRQESKATVPP